MSQPLHTTILRLLAAAVAVMAATACSDDLGVPATTTVPEGEEASVTFSYAIAEPQQLSRSTKLTEEQESKINSLWVGIYNVNSGECTYNMVFASSGDGAQFWGSSTDQLDVTKKTVTIGSVKSGESYIVAVANVFTNYGVMEGYRLELSSGQYKTNIYEDGNELTKMRRIALAYLLTEADTWEKFRAIAAVQLDPKQVTRSTADFPMAGFYCQGTAHPASWCDADGNPSQTAMIYPGSNTLTGLIHLRRQRSYNKFKIIAADNVAVTPVSWQVMNIPVYSSLLTTNGNAGDNAVGLTGRTDLYPSGNYGPGNENNNFDKETYWKSDGDGKACNSFDFYIFANRRTGQEWVSKYEDRELEYKTTTGENIDWTDPAGIKLPVFKSLVATSADDEIDSEAAYASMDLAPNNASYVILTATVDYWAKPEYEADGTTISKYVAISADEATGTNPPAGVVHRHGTGIYTIHLGYCEEKDAAGNATAATARDFNCLRNTNYTYYVTINGLDNIRVEAVQEGEPQPGAEGDVSDSDQSLIQLDCHYCTFNIELSNEERLTLSYDMEIPFKDAVYYYSSRKYGLTNPGTGTSGVSSDLTNWVHFRPTYSEDALAVYKNTKIDGYGDPWTFEQLADPLNYKDVDQNGKAQTDNDAPTLSDFGEENYNNYDKRIEWVNSNRNKYAKWLEKKHYYTIFIDEVVYDNVDGVSTNWYDYTNRPDRKLWLMNENVRQFSKDLASTYIKSKYLIQQHSIDTYYSNVDYQTSFNIPSTTVNNTTYKSFIVTGSNIAETAVGIENTNETLGQNLNWTETLDEKNFNSSYLSNSNGRWNVWRILDGTDGASSTETSWYKKGLFVLSNDRWMTPLTYDSDIMFGSIKAIAAGNQRIPAMSSVVDKVSNGSKLLYPQNGKAAYEAIYQCLSRNRDENGNGTIDADELKWFLPATRTYIRMIIGESSLKAPLVDYDIYGSASAGNPLNGPLHYVTSNYQYIWAEECMALTNNITSEVGGQAWNMRCIRSLGSELNTVTSTTKVDYAYRLFDQSGNELYKADNTDFTAGGYFLMWFYEQVNNASPATDAIPMHYVNNEINKTSFAFEFKGKDTDVQLTNNSGGAINPYDGSDIADYLDKNNPCDKYNTNSEIGWRVPTLQELALMMLVENNKVNDEEIILGFDTSNKYIACTREKLSGSNNRIMKIQHNDYGWYTTASVNSKSNYHIRCVRDVVSE